jgi:hypothetical protein
MPANPPTPTAISMADDRIDSVDTIPPDRLSIELSLLKNRTPVFHERARRVERPLTT